MKRRILIGFVAVIIIGAGAFLYVNNVLLPVKLKEFIVHKSGDLLGRKVDIGEMDFKPIKGFTLERIKIYQKDDPSKILFQAEHVNFNLLLTDIIKTKTVIIPTLKIEKPFLYLSQNAKGELNIQDFFQVGGSEKPAPARVVLKTLIIADGQVDYVRPDSADLLGPFESVQDIDLTVSLSLLGKIPFTFSAVIPKHNSVLSAEGQYDLGSKEATVKLKTKNITLARYLTLFFPVKGAAFNAGLLSSADISIHTDQKGTQISGDASLSGSDVLYGSTQVKGDVRISKLNAQVRNNQITATGSLLTSNTFVALSDNQTFTGNITAQLNSLNISPNVIRSEGQLLIKNGLLKNDQQIFKGDLTLNQARLSVNNGQLDFTGGLGIGEADFKFDPLHSFKGNIRGFGLNIKIKENDIRLSGDVYLDNSVIALGDDQFARGNFALTQNTVKGNGNVWTIKNNTQANAVDLELKNTRLKSNRITASDNQITLKDNKIDAKSSVAFNLSEVTFDGKTFSGSPNIQITYQYDGEKVSPHDYSGTISVVNGIFSGLPFIDTLSQINGNVQIQTDYIQTSNLSFLADETNFILSGNVTNFTNPQAEFSAESKNINLSKIPKWVPSLKTDFGLDLNGLATLNARYKGSVNTFALNGLSARVTLNNTTLLIDKLPEPVTGISGAIDYDGNNVQWNNLTGSYQLQTFVINGSLADLTDISRPTLSTDVQSELIKLTTQIKLGRQSFRILSFKGSYYGLGAELTGDVTLPQDDEPILNLAGTVKLDVKEIPDMVPSLKDQFNVLNVEGALTINGTFKGQPSRWQNWQTSFQAQSPVLMVSSHPFENVTLDFDQKEDSIGKLYLASQIYDGTLTIDGTSSLNEDEIPFNAIIALEKLNLTTFRKGKKLRNPLLSGHLTAGAKLEGYLTQAERVKGAGRFEVSNGYLGQLIPEFRNASFTDAQGDFTIGDGKVTTDNTEVYSQTTDIKAIGWIDFKNNIHFNVVPKLNEMAVAKAGEKTIKIDPSALLTKAVSIEITGTLQRPQYKVSTSPMKVIGNTTGIIKESIGSVLKEIF